MRSDLPNTRFSVELRFDVNNRPVINISDTSQSSQFRSPISCSIEEARTIIKNITDLVDPDVIHQETLKRAIAQVKDILGESGSRALDPLRDAIREIESGVPRANQQ